MNLRDRPNPVNAILGSIVLPVVIVLLNILMVALVVLLIYGDFKVSAASGIRGVVAVIIPLVIVSIMNRYGNLFTIEFSKRPSLAVRLVIHPIVSFTLAVIWGFALMILVGIFSSRPDLPLAELVLAGTFIVLINNAGSAKKRIDLMYAGDVLGLLLYVLFVGVPSNFVRFP